MHPCAQFPAIPERELAQIASVRPGQALGEYHFDRCTELVNRVNRSVSPFRLRPGGFIVRWHSSVDVTGVQALDPPLETFFIL